MESRFNSGRLNQEQKQLAEFTKTDTDRTASRAARIASNALSDLFNAFNTEKTTHEAKVETNNLWSGEAAKPANGLHTQQATANLFDAEPAPKEEATLTGHRILADTGIAIGKFADISKEPLERLAELGQAAANARTTNHTIENTKTETPAAADTVQTADKTEETKKKEDKKTETAKENKKHAKLEKERTSKDGDTTTTVRTYKDGTKEKVVQTGDKTTTITYDKNGKRVSKSVTEGTGETAKKTDVEYKNGVVNKKTVVNGDKTSVVNYNKKGIRTDKTVVNGDKTSVTNYNKEGKPTDKTVTQGEGDNKVVATAKYDTVTGNVTARTKEGVVGGNNVSVAKEYDPKTGKISNKTTTTTTPAGIESKENTTYEYDADGNLTKRAMTDNYGHVTTTAYSDYKKQEDGTITRNNVTTITTSTGNPIGEPVYKEQTLNAAGKILQSNWFFDAEHNNKRKEVGYEYDADNVKTGVQSVSYDEEGNKTREVTQTNFNKTLAGTSYDSEGYVYTTALDGTLQKTVIKQNRMKYFDGSTFIKNADEAAAKDDDKKEETAEVK